MGLFSKIKNIFSKQEEVKEQLDNKRNESFELKRKIDELEIRIENLCAVSEKLAEKEKEANDLADKEGLDLVKISPSAVTPVCRIMDYGKFKFEQDKREKEARKNQRVIEIKEIRMSPSIDTNDLNTKITSAL